MRMKHETLDVRHSGSAGNRCATSIGPSAPSFFGLTQYLVGLPQLPNLAFQFIDPRSALVAPFRTPPGRSACRTQILTVSWDATTLFGKLPLSRPLGFHRHLDASAPNNPRGCVSRLKTDLMPYSLPSPSSDVSLKISDKPSAVPSGS